MNDRDFETLTEAFKKVGIKFEQTNERAVLYKCPVPGAVMFLSVGIAHFHFNEDGEFLGSECNGSGDFVPALD